MDDKNTWVELKNIIANFSILFITSLVDSLFIALWVVVQYFIGFVINTFELNGIDRFVLFVFQILFAVSSLAPVAITIYRDIRIMVLRTNRTIKREIELGKDHES